MNYSLLHEELAERTIDKLGPIIRDYGEELGFGCVLSFVEEFEEVGKGLGLGLHGEDESEFGESIDDFEEVLIAPFGDGSERSAEIHVNTFQGGMYRRKGARESLSGHLSLVALAAGYFF